MHFFQIRWILFIFQYIFSAEINHDSFVCFYVCGQWLVEAWRPPHLGIRMY